MPPSVVSGSVSEVTMKLPGEQDTLREGTMYWVPRLGQFYSQGCNAQPGRWLWKFLVLPKLSFSIPDQFRHCQWLRYGCQLELKGHSRAWASGCLQVTVSEVMHRMDTS